MAKPNILIILGDDLGTDVLRINAEAKTVVAQVNGKDNVAGPVTLPTLSRLLASGVHFRNAWAHPVCTPTRASLWTGLQAWKTKLGFPTGGDDNIESPAINGQNIQTLAQAMTGYKCAMFGKWDLGTKRTPVEWGWQTFAGIFRGGVRPDGVTQYGFPGPPSRINFARLKSATGSKKPDKCAAAARALEAKYDATFLSRNPDLRNYIWEKDTVGPDGKAKPPLGPADRQYIYITEDQVADTKQWIRATPGPWCVALNLVAPHDPYHLPPNNTYQASLIKDAAKPTVQELLLAMIQAVDFYLKDLLAAIESQLANTVIIFACDNGTQDVDPDDQSISIDDTVGDDKATSSIGGIHVPMIVADGGLLMGKAPCYVKTQVPRAVTTPVHLIDIYSTAIDIAGLSPSASLDSISFVPHLDASVQKPTRTHNFSQMYLKPDPGTQTPGIDASVGDTESTYKLSSELLVDADGNPVDRSAKPTTALVFDYKFTRLVPDPRIPSSFKEKPINALTANADGSFTVGDLAYQDKLLELYAVISRERPYDDVNSRFPVIRPSAFVFPAALLNRPVLIENQETKRYLFADGAVFSGNRGAEGGWLSSPNVVGADANYYNRALWIIRQQGTSYLIESVETKRYLFSTGEALAGARGNEAGWLASSGFASPKLVGADANYYNLALWVFQPQGDAFLIANLQTKRYVFSDGPALTRSRGAEGGWLASSGFASPGVVGADANYYNRALWRIQPA